MEFYVAFNKLLFRGRSAFKSKVLSWRISDATRVLTFFGPIWAL